MLEVPVLVNIGQMIDLAIGTPEAGVVDFNMLQTVLHVLAQQQHILGKYVELSKGVTFQDLFDNTDRSTINVHEVKIREMGESLGKKDMDGSRVGAQIQYDDDEEENTLLIVERVPRAPLTPITESQLVEANQASTGRKKKGPASKQHSQKLVPSSPPYPKTNSKSEEGKASFGHRKDSEQRLSIVTAQQFVELESRVEQLREQIQGSMPKAEEIADLCFAEVSPEAGSTRNTEQLDTVRETQKVDKNPVSSTSTKNVDAAASSKSTENAISSQFKDNVEKLGRDVKVVRNELKSLRLAFKDFKRQASGKDDSMQSETLNEEVSANDSLESLGDGQNARHNQGGASPQNVNQRVETKKGGFPGKVCGDEEVGMGRLKDRHNKHGDILAISDRLRQLEKRVDKCCSKVSDVNSSMNKTSLEMKSLKSQVSSTKMDDSLQSIETSMPNEMEGLGELFAKVQELQKHISSLNLTARQLLQDREGRQANMNMLLEQVELLKLCKVEREDVATVLASKADEAALQGKVSRDAFEMVCDDLTRGLQGTVSKLAKQEMALQQTLAGIQNEMENKLDKLEMSPVKEFIQKRLQQLQDGFKRLMNMRKEVLAAGTKQKLLRNVNCLSCDAQVVQATVEGPVMPTPRPMPVPISYSMKAYLSYELDAMRKQRQGPAIQRNLHEWEDIERDMKQRKQAVNTYVSRDAEGAHKCSRYCGGSHTMTAIQQRTTHGKLSFGPDVLHISSGIGDDGKVYRVSSGGAEMNNVTKYSSNWPNSSSIGSSISHELPHSQVRRKSMECTC